MNNIIDVTSLPIIDFLIIVGRTGSGKVCDLNSVVNELVSNPPQSSLTLSLLRCILTEGKVYYDGLPTDTLNLDALRSSITIIPQVVRDQDDLHRA